MFDGDNASMLHQTQRGSMGKGVFMYILKQFFRDEQGMETVEWAVLAALIVAGLVTVIAGLGTNVKNAFTTLSTQTT